MRARRGTSLIEVLMASAILALGLTGVGIMLVQTAASGRTASKVMEASSVGMGSLDVLAAGGVAMLTAGTFDGGMVTDDAGQVLYTRTVTVTPLNAIDGGAAYNGFMVRVDVGWRDALFRQKTQSYGTIVSAPFDAGL